ERSASCPLPTTSPATVVGFSASSTCRYHLPWRLKIFACVPETVRPPSSDSRSILGGSPACRPPRPTTLSPSTRSKIRPPVLTRLAIVLSSRSARRGDDADHVVDVRWLELRHERVRLALIISPRRRGRLSRHRHHD